MRAASEGLRELAEHVGTGKVKVRVRVDQPYAQDQHETLWYRHPRGGRAKYLEGPLFENHREYYGDLADAVLDVGGGDLTDAMGGVGRKLVQAVATNAPVEFGDLRTSAGMKVLEGTRIVQSEAPITDRLTERQLEMKDLIRNAARGTL